MLRNAPLLNPALMAGAHAWISDRRRHVGRIAGHRAGIDAGRNPPDAVSISRRRDGAAPLGGQVRFKGTLYGTTGYAGALGRGAVVADGFVPDSVLLDLDGDLIGTTESSGTTGGVIFSVHP